jgi:ankyrin repeat protein
MRTFSQAKIGFAFLWVSLLFVGCSGDPDAEFKTAFHRAVDIYVGVSYESDIKPDLEPIRQAVEKGANPNLVYQDMTPMYLAIRENDMELAALLVERGAEVGPQDLDRDGEVDYLPLLSAIMDVEEINPDMIKLLIDAGAELDANGDYPPPLEVAVEAGSLETVKALLQAGADPNGHEDWELPLDTAVGEGYVEIFDALRAAGAEVTDPAGLLVFSAGSSNLEMVRRVLPLYSGPKKLPALFGNASLDLLRDNSEADIAGAQTIMRELRAAGFTPVAGDFDEIMIMAASSWDTEALEIMLSYGASANAANDSGESCLILVTKAASVGNVIDNSELEAKDLFKHQDTHINNIVRLLLDHGADVNAKDSKGRTALMYAATSFNVNVVRQLLKKGADPSLVDETGKNAEQQMLASRLLQDQKKETAGKVARAFFGLTPEFQAQARKRAKQIQVDL